MWGNCECWWYGIFYCDLRIVTILCYHFNILLDSFRRKSHWSLSFIWTSRLSADNFKGYKTVDWVETGHMTRWRSLSWQLFLRCDSKGRDHAALCCCTSMRWSCCVNHTSSARLEVCSGPLLSANFSRWKCAPVTADQLPNSGQTFTQADAGGE